MFFVLRSEANFGCGGPALTPTCERHCVLRSPLEVLVKPNMTVITVARDIGVCPLMLPKHIFIKDVLQDVALLPAACV